MKELVDLIQYVSPKRLTRLSFFFRRSGRKRTTYAHQLYDAVAQSMIVSDKEGSNLLFGVEGASHYYKVKYELRQQLLNSVLLVDGDQKELGSYYAMFIQCRKELYTAEVLFVEGHVEAAVEIHKKLLGRAIEAELTDIIIPVLFYLRSYNLNVKPDSVACLRYLELEKKWIRIRTAEEQVDHLYTDLAINYVETAAPPPAKVDAIRRNLANVDKEFGNVTTAKFLYKYYFVKFIMFDSLGEYRQAIRIAWEAVDELNKVKHLPRGYIRSMLMQVIDASIRLRALNDGQRAVIRALKLVEEGARPWFRINQLFLYLCIRSKDFSAATSKINEMLSHRKFKKLPVPLKERYYLLRAYLNWLIEIGVAGTNREKLDSFRIGRFINNVPEFSKDKLGFNVPILVVQALWLLQQRKYLLTRSRLESLKRYALKYLSNSGGVMRTYYFIRVLTQLDNANFHRAAFIRKAAPFYRALQDQPVTENLQSVEVEIVPYEDLYKYTLGLLDNNVH